MSHILSGVLVAALQRRIGQFVDGIDLKSLKLSIWSGRVQLKHVLVRPDVFYTLGLPLVVKSGIIEQLTIEIPWRRLGREPLSITATDVSIVCGPLDEANLDDAELRDWSWTRKQLELQALLQHAELEEEAVALQNEQDITSGSKKATKKKKRSGGITGRVLRSEAFANRLLDQLGFGVYGLHLRFEDETHSRAPFAVGLTLDSAATAIDGSATAKTVSLAGLAVYHSSSSDGSGNSGGNGSGNSGNSGNSGDVGEGSSGGCGDGCDAGGGATTSRPLASSEEARSAIVEPASFDLRITGPSLRTRFKAEAHGDSQRLPPLKVAVDLHELSFRLSQAQLKDVSRVGSHLIDAVEALRRREMSLLLADAVHAEAWPADARGRFRRAITRVLHELQSRKAWRLSPFFFQERRRLRLRYAALYRRSRAKDGKLLTPAEAREKQAIERNRLTASDIFFFRLLAEAEMASFAGGAALSVGGDRESSVVSAAEGRHSMRRLGGGGERRFSRLAHAASQRLPTPFFRRRGGSAAAELPANVVRLEQLQGGSPGGLGAPAGASAAGADARGDARSGARTVG